MNALRDHRHELLALARRSIEATLRHGGQQPCPPYPPQSALAEQRATFVTLRNRGELRGCCGSIEPVRPLAEDVWRNAWASAFCDPRFEALAPTEWPQIDVHLSILSSPEPLPVRSEQELLRSLRPGIDGLILQLGAARATFLPSVWEQLRDPQLFVRHLKQKAGWTPDFWSLEIRVQRYTTESFGEEESG